MTNTGRYSLRILSQAGDPLHVRKVLIVLKNYGSRKFVVSGAHESTILLYFSREIQFQLTLLTDFSLSREAMVGVRSFSTQYTEIGLFDYEL